MRRPKKELRAAMMRLEDAAIRYGEESVAFEYDQKRGYELDYAALEAARRELQLAKAYLTRNVWAWLRRWERDVAR
jgi:hypothetical protein